ncbi:tetratricopeptide repeat protein [Hyphomicrobium sp. 2TAF46]|uniref:tetratricopeptide repeat protein n=1 Tax=Hyphomicrobium sp. 2TAF46 TaxID=3233019 RepID=UPI003F912699
MSNSELSADYPESEGAGSGGENRSELRAMLDVIAAQLADADRRHTAALAEMQERIDGMGREADALRTRVPEEFAPAFGRIETAMAELAHRLADPADAKGFASTGRTPSTNDPYKSTMPMALRSAHNDAHDEYSKRTPDVDTFDVIGDTDDDASDPWDRAAADALRGLYESDETNFAPKARSAAGTVVRATAHSEAGSGIDEAWLDKKFAEIAQGIEQSLAAMRPDNGISQISQRLDQFERQFAKLFEGVATHDDLAAVHLIEAHVAEVVNHLVQTQDQLERLNIIETQLASISHTLAEVQGVPVDGIIGAQPVTRALDYDAIARAAAEQTAQRLADLRAEDRHSAADELRPLIERMMSQNREGEEHTAALLDTMQQAMIRLLDRVDSIEFSQQAAATPPAAESGAYHAGMFSRDATGIAGSVGEETSGSFDSAFVELASSRPLIAPVSVSSHPRVSTGSPEETSRQGEKSRQDFVAEVRRAKKRLSEQDDIAAVPSVSISSSAAEGAMAMPPPGSRPIRPTAAPAKKTSGPSGPSPRLMVIAAVALVALGSLWYTFGFGKPHVGSTNGQETSLPSPQANGAGSGSSGSSDAAKSTPDGSAPAQNSDKAIDPSRDGSGPRGDLAPTHSDAQKTAAEEAPQRTTTLPMLGVAVDLDQPVTAAELEQAKRRQAMATMSGELGNAAARSSEGAAVPASMVPSEAETEGAKSGLTTGSVLTSASKPAPLDIPPATVGPLSLRLAAANGDPSAEFEVGARLAEGKGTAQSFQDAAKWYQRSADQGFAQSQYRLGTLYERGLGLKPDRAQAANWYQRAAAQGNIKAMHNLAVLSANQSDQSPDYVMAAQWFEAAAQRGLSDSQFNLAVLYENGLGVKRDMSRAFMWLSIAARGGDADAVRRRDILRGKLTADEVTAANKMIAAWKPMPSAHAVNDARTAGEMWKNNPKNGVNG